MLAIGQRACPNRPPVANNISIELKLVNHLPCGAVAEFPISLELYGIEELVGCRFIWKIGVSSLVTLHLEARLVDDRRFEIENDPLRLVLIIDPCNQK